PAECVTQNRRPAPAFSIDGIFSHRENKLAAPRRSATTGTCGLSALDLRRDATLVFTDSFEDSYSECLIARGIAHF
ncbi:MAG: hypothetical protein ACREIF_04790, partial [Chthoniobacterales bacterium]